jgi:hypothetical protein
MPKISSIIESILSNKFNGTFLGLLLSATLLGCAANSSSNYQPSDSYAQDDVGTDTSSVPDADAPAEEDSDVPTSASDTSSVPNADVPTEEDSGVPTYAPGELAFTPEEIQAIHALSQLPKEERAKIISPETEQYFAQEFNGFWPSSEQQYQSQPTQSLDDYVTGDVGSGNYSNPDTEAWLDDTRSEVEDDLAEFRQQYADRVAEGASY